MANVAKIRKPAATAPKYTPAAEVEFLTIDAWKTNMGNPSGEIRVLNNTKTGKLFCSFEGSNFKVQQDINPKIPMVFLVPDGSLEDSCLINATGGAEEVFTI